MTLTKKDLVETVRNGCGFTRNESCRLVDELLGTIKGALENGEDVLISGFGKFCVKGKKGRRGRNFATGEDMMLDQRKVVRFKCSSVLKDKINGAG
jgi:integration host factor subunit alpha